MSDIKIIALDLDGTLLTSDKTLSEGNREALRRAAEAGIEIVPTTGRFYGAMPAAVRELPFIHYSININGANLLDVARNESIGGAVIPLSLALEIMKFLDSQDVIYDCYMDNWGYMTRTMQENCEQYCFDVHFRKMIYELRKPVKELKAYLRRKKHDVQKILLFAKTQELHDELWEELPKRFPDIVVSSSIPNNIEINHKDANKGKALLDLAEYLGCTREQTLACGDAVNDLPMVREAGIGVCMANGDDRVKAVARYVSGTNDEDGVAEAIYKFCNL